MTKPTDTSGRVQREAHLRWVPIPAMKIPVQAQRDRIRTHRVDHLVANFDLEKLGNPTVNLRDGGWYLIDGMHRVEACKEIGWGDQQLQCWAYEGLTEAEEAEKFLSFNDVLPVDSFDKFRVGVNAGRQVEQDIDRIVRAQQLRIARDKQEGSIGAVGTLRRVYKRGGPNTLARALGIVRDAYGTPGLEAAVIDGVGYLCQRYNGQLDEETAVVRLRNLKGGVNGLLGRADVIRRSTGSPLGSCVAAAAVDVINAGRGGKKLPSWWNEPA